MIAFEVSIPISFAIGIKYLISSHASDIAMYSASVVDFATVGWSFDFHDMQVVPRNITNPDVDLRVSRSPAQSASEYALIISD